MKLWKLAATVAVGIWASGSGAIQVQAAVFNFSVNFDDKIVPDFSNFDQTFIPTTSGLTNKVRFRLQMAYSMATSAVQTPTDMQFDFIFRPNGAGPTTNLGATLLPDLSYRTTPGDYNIEIERTLPDNFILNIINEPNFIQFRPTLTFIRNSTQAGRVITIHALNVIFTVQYDFNTTYLFNYFLSATDFQSVVTGGLWSGSPTIENRFIYVMTTAGNDTYFLTNSSTTEYGPNLNKFAVDYNNEYFRGDSVGAQHATAFGPGYSLTQTAPSNTAITISYNYHFLNVSNKRQPLADVPQFNFLEQDCGSFLAVNVGCFINNGLAYITNDAPIISDIFTLLNTGMQLGGQAFSVFGNFSDNNLFGVLILGGAGLTAVRWFLKQDQ